MHHNNARTRRYLRESKRLGDVRNMVFRSRAKFSVEQATTMIIARKAIKPQSAHFRTRCVGVGVAITLSTARFNANG